MQLSYERQVSLLSAIVPLADNMFEYASTLRAQGFDAFDPWENFICSFCEGAERKEHKSYVIEEAKVHIGAPDKMSGHLVGRGRGYKSPLIEEARRNRERLNKTSFLELPSEERWKGELDPCTRQLRKLGEDHPVVKSRRLEMITDFYRRRERELLEHASRAIVERQADIYTKFFSDLLQSYLEPLGFERDATRSKPFFPVLSKSLTPNWDICWSLESDKNLRLLPQYGSSLKRMRLATPLDLHLFVVSKGGRGPFNVPVGFQTLNFMLIDFPWLVPGFSWAYGDFEDSRELEVIVKAHACLYDQVSSSIETTLAKHLQS